MYCADIFRERGEVKSMREGFGFISPITNSQKSYFFRSRDVEGKVQLQSGDAVDFFLIPDPRNPAEQLASGIRRIGSNDAISNLTFGGMQYMLIATDQSQLGKKKINNSVKNEGSVTKSA